MSAAFLTRTALVSAVSPVVVVDDLLPDQSYSIWARAADADASLRDSRWTRESLACVCRTRVLADQQPLIRPPEIAPRDDAITVTLTTQQSPHERVYRVDVRELDAPLQSLPLRSQHFRGTPGASVSIDGLRPGMAYSVVAVALSAAGERSRRLPTRSSTARRRAGSNIFGCIAWQRAAIKRARLLARSPAPMASASATPQTCAAFLSWQMTPRTWMRPPRSGHFWLRSARNHRS